MALDMPGQAAAKVIGERLMHRARGAPDRSPLPKDTPPLTSVL
jgi:hypothetical protein